MGWLGLWMIGLAATVSCGSEAPAGAVPKGEWTVLAYLSGDSDLEPWAARYLAELQQAGSTRAVRVAVMLDRRGVQDDSTGQPGRAQWYLLGGTDEGPKLARSWPNPVNMGDPRTLEEFALWGARMCPAHRYVLLLVGHGTGVAELSPEGAPLDADASCGIGLDEGSGGDCLQPGELRTACRAIAEALGQTIDVVALDACFSGTIELAWEIAASARVLCCHPGALHAPGVPWGGLIQSLQAFPEMEPEQLAAAYVAAVAAQWNGEETPAPAVAAIRTAAIPELMKAVRELATVLQQDTPRWCGAVTLARAEAASYGPSMEYRSLWEFADGLAAAAGTEVGGPAQRVSEQCRAVTIAGAGLGGSLCGPVILLPPNLSALPAGYAEEVGFARESGWAAFLGNYLSHLRGLLSPERARGDEVRPTAVSPQGVLEQAPEPAAAAA